MLAEFNNVEFIWNKKMRKTKWMCSDEEKKRKESSCMVLVQFSYPGNVK